MICQDDLEILTNFLVNNDLSEEKLITELCNQLTPINVARKVILFRQDQVATSHFFLARGIVRYYVSDLEGREHTKSFRRGPTFIGSAYATHGGDKAPFTAQVVHATRIYALGLPFWQALLNSNPAFIKFYTNHLVRLFIEKEKRELSLLQDSAEKKYHQFLLDYQEQASYIPQWMIASYLGITPEALSRVKRHRKAFLT